MRKFFTMIAALIMIASAGAVLNGCKKEESTGDKVGNVIDNATKEASNAAEDASKAVDDAKKDLTE